MPEKNDLQRRVEAFLSARPKYEHKPWLALGATDSAHGVFFVSNGKNTYAVKAYEGPGGLARAEHERKMLNVIREAGFLTFETEGTEQNEKANMAFLLTKYIPDLRSMSSVVQGGSTVSVDIQLQRTARTLGALHEASISHGDAQIKNFMIDPRDKKRILIPDPERGGTDSMGHVKSRPYAHDVESLVQSLAYKGYGGPNLTIACDMLMENVIDPYMGELEKSITLDEGLLGIAALDVFIAKHEDIRAMRSRVA